MLSAFLTKKSCIVPQPPISHCLGWECVEQLLVNRLEGDAGRGKQAIMQYHHYVIITS